MNIPIYLRQRYKAIAALVGGVIAVLLNKYFPELFANDPTIRGLISAIILSLIVERIPNKK